MNGVRSTQTFLYCPAQFSWLYFSKYNAVTTQQGQEVFPDTFHSNGLVGIWRVFCYHGLVIYKVKKHCLQHPFTGKNIILHQAGNFHLVHILFEFKKMKILTGPLRLVLYSF